MDAIEEDRLLSSRVAVKPLNVIVIGAGIGGLAVGLALRKTGHHVQILEKRQVATEVGAGIQLPPNAARILHRLGVLKEVFGYTTFLKRNSLRRYNDDDELGSVPLGHIEKEFGWPLGVVHRADLHAVLLKAATEAGCEILTGHQVLALDKDFRPQVTYTHNGKEGMLSGDLVIAADGMNSPARKVVAAAHGHEDRLTPTGESAYRIMLPKELMEHDEKLMAILNEDMGLRYMGPGGHIMAYPLRKNTLYNVVLIHPTDPGSSGSQTSWLARGRKDALLANHADWSALVRALLAPAPAARVLATALHALAALPAWSAGGAVALLGDACHHMAPFVAQGAANALEDAGVLAAALTRTGDVALALAVYERVRKPRAEKMAASAEQTGRNLHLPDGPEQVRRDEAIRAAAAAARREGDDDDDDDAAAAPANPDHWNDRERTREMWGVDVMRDTIENWDELAAEVVASRTHTDGGVLLPSE
ncbi:putative salicylate hydroxylase [Xylariomycetidae sp. FL0641]|nr:putative salicylate hydroxylase [Xylariomycetidae sp. FL0641]